MAKVFRLHNFGSNILKGWDLSQPYGTAVINDIQDPNGATCMKEITSIPSPFARMDLVKSAFKVIAECGEVEGDTIYHKLVSDALDVGEIFFNVDRLRDKIRILVWDKTNDLRTLLDSPMERHRLLGETLRLYLEQDVNSFHFDKLQRIYLLDYIGPGRPNPMNIIGATSPATLFFSSANDLSYVSQNVAFGKDRPFDWDFQPLYKRDFDYQSYWFCLRLAIPDFAMLFPDVSRYLDLSYQRLSNEQKNAIALLQPIDMSNRFDDLFVDAPTNGVEVLGYSLKKKRPVTDIQSDFKIKSGVCRAKKLPLVLPVSTYTKPLRYVTAVWDKNTRVPYTDPKALVSRILPGDGTQYPYLTIGDFLEDYILFDRDPFNKESFFNGSSDDRQNNSYLLPLRKEFFNYFTPAELMGTMPDGKRMFELEANAGGVKAVLRIPIQRNEYIVYERLYFKDAMAEPTDNKGGIIARLFNVALLPNIKFMDSSVKANYRVALLREKLQVDLNFYRGSEQVQVKGMTDRNSEDLRYTFNTTYLVAQNFDYIVFGLEKQYRGVILPRWKEPVRGNKQFVFAVDFGTTNTHIEYRVDDSAPVVFDIGLEDKQLHRLNTWAGASRPLRHDYFPDLIGIREADVRFPIRTVLSERSSIDWDTPVFTVADTNVPFLYEKENMSDYNKITTNLKWSNDANMQKKVYHYLSALFFLMRNKVLLNGGQLDTTKIIWFYPASMTQGRYNAFSSIWNELYRDNFGDNIRNVISMSESITPYYYYKNKRAATTNVVSIDIGGGTTDVLVVNNGREQLLTSFRFAANSIFGDGYGYDADTNGFVSYFERKIKNIFEKNAQEELLAILEKLESKKDSAEIISFFFSLADNVGLQKKNLKIDFNDELRNDEKGRYVFVFFYMAVIYYVARVMKSKGMQFPRYVTFSGTGSKILDVVTTSDSTLEWFTKVIFENVYEFPYDSDGLTVFRELENPKEATCKGGLLNSVSQNYMDINSLKQVLLGDMTDRFVTSGWTYGEVNDEFLKGVQNEVEHFCDLFIRLNYEFSYADTFGANSAVWPIVEQCCKRDLKKYLYDGINKKMEEIRQMGLKTKVEESFFFYALVGVLNKMAQEVYKFHDQVFQSVGKTIVNQQLSKEE